MKQIAGAIHADSDRIIELCRCCRPSVSTESSRSVACDRVDDTIGRHHADAVILDVGDKQITRSIDGEASRGPKLRSLCGTTIAAGAPRSTAYHCADDSVRGYFSDPIVVCICNEHVARTIHSHTVSTLAEIA